MRRGVRSGALLLTAALGVAGTATTRAQQGTDAQPAATVPQTNTAVFQVEGMT